MQTSVKAAEKLFGRKASPESQMKPKDFRTLAKFPCLFYDLKSVFEKSEMEQVGFTYMAL